MQEPPVIASVAKPSSLLVPLDCRAALAMTGVGSRGRNPVIQVIPLGIDRLDQRELFRPRPCLDLLFATDGTFHRIGHFKPDEPLASVSFRKPIRDAFAMLPHALDKVRCDAGVKRAVALTRHDVDGGLFHR